MLENEKNVELLLLLIYYYITVKYYWILNIDLIASRGITSKYEGNALADRKLFFHHLRVSTRGYQWHRSITLRVTDFEDNEAISRDVMVIALFNIWYINGRIMSTLLGLHGIFGKFDWQMSRKSWRALSIGKEWTIYPW